MGISARIIEPELCDAGRNLSDLRVGVRPGIPDLSVFAGDFHLCGIVAPHERRVVTFSGDPKLDEAVNKRELSTGENGEFAAEVALGWLLARPAGVPRLVLWRV